MSQAANLEPLLQVEELVVEFPAAHGTKTHAVSGVSFHIGRGETVGLVGESGCGKSSLARAIMQIQPITAGKIILGGIDLAEISKSELRRMRSRFQMVFQDPIASLNPIRTVGESIELALRTTAGSSSHAESRNQALEMLSSVGLHQRHYDRKPSQLSGGQCQRACIARALICRPELLVCDEPVSSLDVSVQAQILNLLRELKSRLNLSMLFISHDLAVVKNVSDKVAVMHLGHLCEIGPCIDLFRTPAHPYTKMLLDSPPQLDPRQQACTSTTLAGELPSALNPPSGCRFRTRCPYGDAVCAELQPKLREIGPRHLVACHFPLLK